MLREHLFRIDLLCLFELNGTDGIYIRQLHVPSLPIPILLFLIFLPILERLENPWLSFALLLNPHQLISIT